MKKIKKKVKAFDVKAFAAEWEKYARDLKYDATTVLNRLQTESRAMGTELATNAERMNNFTTYLQEYARKAQAINDDHRRLALASSEQAKEIITIKRVLCDRDAEYNELIATQRSRIDNLENEIRAAVHRAALRVIEQNEERDLMKIRFSHDIDVLHSRCSAGVASHVMLWITVLGSIAALWFNFLKPY